MDLNDGERLVTDLVSESIFPLQENEKEGTYISHWSHLSALWEYNLCQQGQNFLLPEAGAGDNMSAYQCM